MHAANPIPRKKTTPTPIHHVHAYVLYKLVESIVAATRNEDHLRRLEFISEYSGETVRSIGGSASSDHPMAGVNDGRVDADAVAAGGHPDPPRSNRPKFKKTVFVVYEVKAAATAGEGEPPVPEGKIRLSQENVDAILAEDTTPHRMSDPSADLDLFRSLLPPELYEATARVLHHAARTEERRRSRIVERQAWVRGELEKKGYVDVDEDKALTFTAIHLEEELE
uniref:Uncharacterized protein n=1 Tax=Oryza brachyantha TaxID=4533 RepID=J3N9N9_ORYBR